MTAIKFGTDGWRGLIARDFTFHNVALCAQGVANYLRREGIADKGLVVGYDTRFASAEFAAQVAEVMAGNGIRVFWCGKACPTPVISYSILHQGAAGAAVITASHNPPLWNGFKYKPHYAGSASPDIIARLEEEIEKVAAEGVNVLTIERARSQQLVRDVDPLGPYFEQIGKLVDLKLISGAGLKVMADAMYGAGGGYLPLILGGGSTSVQEINGEPNPAFPGIRQPEPIAPNLQRLSQLVVDEKADVGIALDGDADRLGVVDEKGSFITTLQAFALIALYLLELKGERGPLVKSLTSTAMVDKLGKLYKVPVHETRVGFKYIGPVMMAEQALMGGEESGGFGFRGHIPERDGILSGLLVLELMARTGRRPSELIQHLYSKVGPHFYNRRDVTFDPEARNELQTKLAALSVEEIAGRRVHSVDYLDGTRFKFDNAWLLLRFSGTEPLLRLYAEAESIQGVEELLDATQELLGLQRDNE